MFTNPNSLGWITGDLLTEDQINYIGSALPDCIDGGAGGTYTISAPIVINGDDLVIGENIEVNQDMIVGDDLSVGGTSVLAGTFIIGNLEISGTTLLNDDVTMGNVAINGNATLGNSAADAVTITAGTVACAAALSYTGSGRELRKGIVLPNSDSTVNITEYRHLIIPVSVTGTRTYTIIGSPIEGDWFMLQNNDTATHELAGLVTISPVGANAGYMYMYLSGAWNLAMIWTI